MGDRLRGALHEAACARRALPCSIPIMWGHGEQKATCRGRHPLAALRPDVRVHAPRFVELYERYGRPILISI